MASVIRRTFACTPTRSASETWDLIVSLLAPDSGSDAHRELKLVGGVASSALSSEASKEDPIVVCGKGPVVRIYCVFNEDAVTGDGVDESSLAQCPTAGDWNISLPCPKEDLEWTQKKLKSLSKRVTARALGESVDYDSGSTAKAVNAALGINLEEFLKP